MKTERLVIMANQIGDFYKSFPDKEQSKQDIADHLKKFWAQSMRDQVVQDIKDETAAAAALQPIVRDAIEKYLTAN